MAQAYGACWVVQKDAMDSSLQAKSAMSTTKPPRPGVRKRPLDDRFAQASATTRPAGKRPGSFSSARVPSAGSSHYRGNDSLPGTLGNLYCRTRYIDDALS